MNQNYEVGGLDRVAGFGPEEAEVEEAVDGTGGWTSRSARRSARRGRGHVVVVLQIQGKGVNPSNRIAIVL